MFCLSFRILHYYMHFSSIATFFVILQNNRTENLKTGKEKSREAPGSISTGFRQRWFHASIAFLRAVSLSLVRVSFLRMMMLQPQHLQEMWTTHDWSHGFQVHKLIIIVRHYEIHTGFAASYAYRSSFWEKTYAGSRPLTFLRTYMVFHIAAFYEFSPRLPRSPEVSIK